MAIQEESADSENDGSTMMDRSLSGKQQKKKTTNSHYNDKDHPRI